MKTDIYLKTWYTRAPTLFRKSWVKNNKYFSFVAPLHEEYIFFVFEIWAGDEFNLPKYNIGVKTWQNFWFISYLENPLVDIDTKFVILSTIRVKVAFIHIIYVYKHIDTSLI